MARLLHFVQTVKVLYDNQYVTVSVDFINPLGDQTTFVRTFILN